MISYRTLPTFVVLISIISIGGCSTSTHYSTSVVQYLYPDQNEPIQASEIPILSLPLKVGIAFIPETKENRKHYGTTFYGPAHYSGSSGLTEKEKMSLMQEVSEHFKKYEFVKSIELIPSAYLRPKGSFSNLDQLRTMFGVDVIALISLDQSQFVDEGFSTISYWTLIGAYVVKGEKNDTHTMLDAAVYHIQSRKMMFRAPGISHIKSKATPVNLTEQARLDSLAGFKEASNDLVLNLDGQLQLFKEKVKDSSEDFKIVHKSGYTGSGRIDAIFLALVLIIGGLRLWTLKKDNT